MKKYLKKPTLLIVVAVILLSLLANFIINYSNFFGEDNLSFYNYDESYGDELSVFNSYESYVTFDYPSSWIYEITEESDKVTETLSLNPANHLNLVYSKLPEDNLEDDILQIVGDSYAEMDKTFNNYGYTQIDNGILYNDGIKIYYAKFSKGNHFFNKYSWKSNNGFLCEMSVTFEKMNLDQFNIIFESIHFLDSENLNTFKSNFSNFTFNYPITFSLLDSFYDEKSKIVSQTLLKNENTSITVNLQLLGVNTQKSYYNGVAKESNQSLKLILERNGFKLFSTGTITIDNVDFAYSFYRKDNKFTYVYYWYEIVNGKPTGGNVILRFTTDDAKDFNAMLRTSSFD